MVTLDEIRAVLTEGPRGAVLQVRVVPRAGRTGLAGIRNGALLVRLAAPPVEGAANDLLVTFLADVLDVPRRDLRIEHGLRSRTKRLAISGRPINEIVSRLKADL